MEVVDSEYLKTNSNFLFIIIIIIIIVLTKFIFK